MTIKPIADFPGYFVSDTGEVYSTKSGQRVQIKPMKHSSGYCHVSLRRSGRSHTKRVHTLVLKAFCGPRPLGCQCSHLDGVRSNNALSNLSWESVSENNLRKAEHGTLLYGSKIGNSKLKDQEVFQIRDMLAAGVTTRKLSQTYGVHIDTIRDIKRGITWARLT